MLRAWWRALQGWREKRLAQRHAIPDELWALTLARYPFLARRSASDLSRLRQLSSLFLARKEFHGVGLPVTDEMAVAIAAQACLPVLQLGLAGYDGFVGIVVQPDEVVALRSETDDDGVVHEFEEPLTGEAMVGGPVMLAWADVAAAGESADEGYNVVIHEFAHVLDMQDGLADGVPPLGSMAERAHWQTQLDAELVQLNDRLDRGELTALDPYGAEGPEELFAVAAEAFFVAPLMLRAEHPALYSMLAGYFRQDPAGD